MTQPISERLLKELLNAKESKEIKNFVEARPTISRSYTTMPNFLMS